MLSVICSLPTGPDDDPLPNEDGSADDGDDNSKEFITIKVTNPSQSEDGTDSASGKLTMTTATATPASRSGGKSQQNGDKNGPNTTMDADGDEHEVTMQSMHGHAHAPQGKIFGIVKISTLLVVWLVFTGFLMSKNEKELEPRQMTVPEGRFRSKFSSRLIFRSPKNYCMIAFFSVHFARRTSLNQSRNLPQRCLPQRSAAQHDEQLRFSEPPAPLHK